VTAFSISSPSINVAMAGKRPAAKSDLTGVGFESKLETLANTLHLADNEAFAVTKEDIPNKEMFQKLSVISVKVRQLLGQVVDLKESLEREESQGINSSDEGEHCGAQATATRGTAYGSATPVTVESQQYESCRYLQELSLLSYRGQC
jgi:hypothetical protein